MEDCVIWNEIHHKTGAPGHAYPDPNYLDNVIAELAAQGVTTDDLPPGVAAADLSVPPKSRKL